jgi:hypothetical protein
VANYAASRGNVETSGECYSGFVQGLYKRARGRRAACASSFRVISYRSLSVIMTGAGKPGVTSPSSSSSSSSSSSLSSSADYYFSPPCRAFVPFNKVNGGCSKSEGLLRGISRTGENAGREVAGSAEGTARSRQFPHSWNSARRREFSFALRRTDGRTKT